MATGKKLPDFATDEEADHFVATADLAEYDLSGFVVSPIVFDRNEHESKVSVPRSLFDRIKIEAEREGISSDQFIRRALESAVRSVAPA